MTYFDSKIFGSIKGYKRVLEKERREGEKAFNDAVVVASRIARLDQLDLSVEILVGAALFMAGQCGDPSQRETFRQGGAEALLALKSAEAVTKRLAPCDLIVRLPEKSPHDVETELHARGFECHTDGNLAGVARLWEGSGLVSDLTALVEPHGGAVAVLKAPRKIHKMPAMDDMSDVVGDEPTIARVEESAEQSVEPTQDDSAPTDAIDLVAIVPNRLPPDVENAMAALGLNCNTDKRRKAVSFIWEGKANPENVSAIVTPHGGTVNAVNLPSPVNRQPLALGDVACVDRREGRPGQAKDAHETEDVPVGGGCAKPASAGIDLADGSADCAENEGVDVVLADVEGEAVDTDAMMAATEGRENLNAGIIASAEFMRAGQTTT
jgi:hypothetical protein